MRVDVSFMLKALSETFANTSCLVSMVALWTSIAGILIVCWTLREVFNDLFQPSTAGSLSSFVSKKLYFHTDTEGTSLGHFLVQLEQLA